ncbi:hypothetical protein ACQ4PT_021614 [Festuca glaucescens]
MGSVEERRGAVEIERERAEQDNFGFNLDLSGQALQSFHGPPVEVELEVEERRESRWVNHPMGAGNSEMLHTIWNAVPEMSTDDDTADDGEALYRGQVIDEEKETNCPGKNYSIGEAKRMESIWLTNLARKNAEYSKLRQQIEDLPFPLRVLPAATCLCVRRGYCYHCKYMTHDTSTTVPVLGYREPAEMLQIFFLCLSCSEVSYPIIVYGIIAVRDDLEPLRNHVFCHSRDDAVMIEQDSFTLPICTPCRGTGFDHEIVMFDDKCCMNEKILKHVVAVKSKGKLDVHLKIEKSLFCWTFQDGVVGPVTSPDDWISVYGQFRVRAFFAPKDMQPSSRPTYCDWLKVDPML